jgi:hypothetical protein
MILETTNVAKFKNRTPKALRLLAFLEAKKGHGQALQLQYLRFAYSHIRSYYIER